MVYDRFLNLKTKIESNILTEDIYEKNKYLDPIYFQAFLEKFVPFIPLWTPVVNCKFKNGVETRVSNTTVESWFKTVKLDILQESSRQKCGCFIPILRDRVESICKQVKLNISKKRLTRPVYEYISKPIYDITANNTNIDAVEDWDKKQK